VSKLCEDTSVRRSWKSRGGVADLGRRHSVFIFGVAGFFHFFLVGCAEKEDITVSNDAVMSTAVLYTMETRIQCIQGSHKTTPFADWPMHSANAHSFRRSYIVARRSSIDFGDRQPRTGRPTNCYPLSKLIPFLSICYRPNLQIMSHKPAQHSRCKILPSN
jgi:hypothetical protein